jgi:hypothetical protein
MSPRLRFREILANKLHPRGLFKKREVRLKPLRAKQPARPEYGQPPSLGRGVKAYIDLDFPMQWVRDRRACPGVYGTSHRSAEAVVESEH